MYNNNSIMIIRGLRRALGPAAKPHLTLVRDGHLAIHILEHHGPSSKALGAQRSAVLPRVELADQEDLLRIRQPLTKREAPLLDIGALEPLQAL